MTASLGLRLYAATTIGVLLLVRLSWPFGSLRSWFQSGPYVAHGDAGWAVVDGPTVTPCESVWQARAKVGPLNLLRSWVGELLACPYCCAAWIALFFASAFLPGTAWERLQFWPVLWLSASATVVVLDRVAE